MEESYWRYWRCLVTYSFPMEMVEWVFLVLLQYLKSAAMVLSYSWGVISQQWPHSDSASLSRARNLRHGGMYSKHSLWKKADSADHRAHINAQTDEYGTNTKQKSTQIHTHTQSFPVDFFQRRRFMLDFLQWKHWKESILLQTNWNWY